MPTRRLKETHPVMQKLEKVFKLMEEEGISFQIGRYGEIEIIHDSVVYNLKDLDEEHCINDLPPFLDYKVTREVEG